MLALASKTMTQHCVSALANGTALSIRYRYVVHLGLHLNKRYSDGAHGCILASGKRKRSNKKNPKLKYLCPGLCQNVPFSAWRLLVWIGSCSRSLPWRRGFWKWPHAGSWKGMRGPPSVSLIPTVYIRWVRLLTHRSVVNFKGRKWEIATWLNRWAAKILSNREIGRQRLKKYIYLNIDMMS